MEHVLFAQEERNEEQEAVKPASSLHHQIRSKKQYGKNEILKSLQTNTAKISDKKAKEVRRQTKTTEEKYEAQRCHFTFSKI